MAKKTFTLNEQSLKTLIKTAALKVLKEEVDELSPEFMKHAAEVANDKAKALGRNPKGADADMKAKRQGQRDAFKKYAAQGLEDELGDPRLHVHSDLRTLDATEGDNQIHFRPGMDTDEPIVYDNSLEAGLDEYPEIHARDRFTDYDDTIKPAFQRFNKFHGLSEAKQNEIINRVVNENFDKFVNKGLSKK